MPSRMKNTGMSLPLRQMQKQRVETVPQDIAVNYDLQIASFKMIILVKFWHPDLWTWLNVLQLYVIS